MVASGMASLTFNVHSDIDIGFKLGDFLELRGVNLDTTIEFATPTSNFHPTVDFDLNSIGIDSLKVALPDFLSLSATNAQFNFTPTASHRHLSSEPDRAVLAHFGTIAAQLKIDGLGDISGSITNLDILPNFQPDFAHVWK